MALTPPFHKRVMIRSKSDCMQSYHVGVFFPFSLQSWLLIGLLDAEMGVGEIFKIHSLLLPAHIISHHLPVERTNVKDQFPVAPCEKHHTWEEERGKKICYG